MQHRSLFLPAAALLLATLAQAPTAAVAADTPPTVCSLQGILFPTGNDAQGHAHASKGSDDLHWTTSYPLLPQAAAPVEILAQEDLPSLDWVHNEGTFTTPVGSSSLISRQWVGTDRISPLFRFDHQPFTLPAEADLASVKIEVAFAARGYVMGVQLNGVTVWTPKDPLLSGAALPGTLAGSVALRPLAQHGNNTLSVVVLQASIDTTALLSVWFPTATFESTIEGGGCGAGASPVVEVVAPVQVEPDVPISVPTSERRGLFGKLKGVSMQSHPPPPHHHQQQQQQQQNPSFVVLDAKKGNHNTRRSLASSPAPPCPIGDSLHDTLNSTAWELWYRTPIPTETEGPWSANVKPDGWLSLSRPSVANRLFYETNLTLPAEANLAEVVVEGKVACDLTLLAVYLNGESVWVNQDVFASAGALTDPPTAMAFSLTPPSPPTSTSTTPSPPLWQHGTNILTFAVLANADKEATAAFHATFTTATYTGCAPTPVLLKGTTTPTHDLDLPTCSEGCRLVSKFELANASSGLLGLAIDPVAQLAYVISMGEGEDDYGEILRYNLLTGAKLTTPFPAPGLELTAPSELAVGPAGEVYVVDDDVIKSFEKGTGKLLGQWGPMAAFHINGLSVLPYGGVDGKETWVYVLAGHEVKGFSTTTNATVTWDGCWVEDEAVGTKKCFDNPLDIAVSFNLSAAGAGAGAGGGETPVPTLWVLDLGTKNLELFDLQTWKKLPGEGGRKVLAEPSAIHVDSFRGVAYVVEAKDQDVLVYDRQGQIWHNVGDVEDECRFFKGQRFFTSTALRGFASVPLKFEQPVEVGLSFGLMREGSLTALHYYKAEGEKGTHNATVWEKATGRVLARLSLYGLTSSVGGWQKIYLEEALELEAGVEYILSMNVNSWGVALMPHYPATAAQQQQWKSLSNGKDLVMLNGALLNVQAGAMPVNASANFFLDVEIETLEPAVSDLMVGAVPAAYTAAAYALPGGSFYMNHLDEETEPETMELHALRCSGYPDFVSECETHLDDVPAVYLEDLKASFNGTSKPPLGFHYWGGRYSLEPSVDYLAEGVALAKEVGMETMAIYMGGEVPPSELYPFNSPEWPAESSAASLTDLAKLPYYKALFADPAIKTYVINANAVSTVGVGLKLRFNRYTVQDADKDTAEFRAFAYHLATTYKDTGKTFILQAWSLDTFLANNAKTEMVTDWATRAAVWLNARQAGVEAGRSDAGLPTTSVAIYHAVQVSRGVLAKAQGQITPWAIDRLLPLITTDLVGWSAYEASRRLDAVTAVGLGIEALQKALKPSEQTSYKLDGLHYPYPSLAAGATNQQMRVYIAEIGDPDLRLKGQVQASKLLLPGAIKGALAKNVPLILYWAGYNSEVLATDDTTARPWTESHAGYWLKRPDGTPSFAMCYLQALLEE